MVNVLRKGDLQQTHSHLEFFMMLFPPTQFDLIMNLTNGELAKNKKNYTTTGEIINFYGVMMLVTRFEFDNHASLWSNVSTNKYIPALSFGMMGMVHKQFDDLWMCIHFSYQPPTHPEQYCWRFVDDFIHNFNEHHAQEFSPSDEICINESMSLTNRKEGERIVS